MYEALYSAIIGFAIIVSIMLIVAFKNNWIKICSKECLDCPFVEEYPNNSVCKNCKYSRYAWIKD